jgi:hypothetical protein
VLFPRRHLDGIADGSVTLAFRRWERPRVKAGTRMRTAVGLVAVDAVDKVEDVTDEELARAGLRSREEALGAGRRGDLYRIALRLEGPDPRIALREGEPTEKDFARLARLPWAYDYLSAIAEHPGVRAADLAESFGLEKHTFKLRVRQLKELGMTESLSPGYRIAPRGEAALRARDRGAGTHGDPARAGPPSPSKQ